MEASVSACALAYAWVVFSPDRRSCRLRVWLCVAQAGWLTSGGRVLAKVWTGIDWFMDRSCTCPETKVVARASYRKLGISALLFGPMLMESAFCGMPVRIGGPQ